MKKIAVFLITIGIILQVPPAKARERFAEQICFNNNDQAGNMETTAKAFAGRELVAFFPLETYAHISCFWTVWENEPTIPPLRPWHPIAEVPKPKAPKPKIAKWQQQPNASHFRETAHGLLYVGGGK